VPSLQPSGLDGRISAMKCNISRIEHLIRQYQPEKSNARRFVSVGRYGSRILALSAD
jgi:hypothetical protein